MKKLFGIWFIALLCIGARTVLYAQEVQGLVAVMRMNMLILPGTSEYLKKTIHTATEEGAKIIIVKIDTPGGMLNTSQEMIQELLNAPVPVVVYVFPSGASATSAGVFITLAGHVAAMAPGTNIGAAHPVSGDGKDIEGDMRAKVENMTVAMVKSIAAQRGRNAAWAEKAVKESVSITEQEALKKEVIDVIAPDIDSLLKKIAGRKVKVDGKEVILEDFSSLARKDYEISFRDQSINTLANPNVAALLWLAATTGISLELYNPGAILPGVVGAICLILALAVSQIIPITQGGVLLLILGSLLIGSELFITSGILGVAGVISIVLGSIYLIDPSEAPGLSVSLGLIIPIASILGICLLSLVYAVFRSARKKAKTGIEAMAGLTARALENFSSRGKVFVNGEVWSAELSQGFAEKDESLEVVKVKEGLTLEVKKQTTK